MAEYDLIVGTNAAYGNAGGSGGGSKSSDIDKTMIARVTFVLLDDSDKEKFNALGGWSSVGAIECKTFINNNNANAKPIVAFSENPSISQYPLINELVSITQKVSKDAQGAEKNYTIKYYYNLINTRNGVEHNATPDESFFKNGDEKVTGIFTEKGNIVRKINSPGDISFEGRSGHSIKLGSTIKGFNSAFSGPDRSPLIIISNNHYNPENNKIPNFEDVNKDGTSIYMLNGHSVGYIPSSFNLESYGEEVSNTVVSNYIEPTPITNEVPVDKSPVEYDVKKDTIPDQIPIMASVESRTEPVETDSMSYDEAFLPYSESDDGYYQETDSPLVFTEQVTQYPESVGSSVNIYSDDPKITSYTKSIISDLTKVEIGSDIIELPKYISQDKKFKDFISKPGVHQKIKNICAKKGCSVGSLYTIMYAESGFKTSIVNNVGATGLIQFMPNTAKGLGTTVEKLATMDELTQLEYVDKFFLGTKKKLTNIYNLYEYIFMPIILDKPLNWIIQYKGVSAEKISKQNPAIATASGKKPGVPLTKYDFYKYIDKLISPPAPPKKVNKK